ncbi:CDK-activating kinase assembly factor MAT1-domain-containing protein [Flagelloscypha sp. PMI_526]|nr:CDK-activating kinase assembly factor MAT1-domain-containing protein [Flagelloscypha sp. PMI_526]
MSNRSWLQGKTVRKTGGAQRVQNHQVQSTSSTVFGGGVKDPSGRVSEFYSMDDQCPVCKSDRYLNPKLRLLVSTLCYHKMCESCIDRLFTLGPAACPVCSTQLRKLVFSPQTFEDLGVEKEVAVRRVLARDFNKTRDDFDDLDSYNKYLEEVEDIAWNMIHDIDREATKKRIEDYKAANAVIIAANIKREAEYAQALKDQEDHARKEREFRAEELRKQEDEEREERERNRKEIIDKLETSDKAASKLIAKTREKAMKRNEAKSSSTTLSFQAVSAQTLRARAAQSTVIVDPPHVALQDDWYSYDNLFHIPEGGYNDPYTEEVRRDRKGEQRAGGYRVEEAWERALRSSVASLDLMPLRESQPKSDEDIIMAG